MFPSQQTLLSSPVKTVLTLLIKIVMVMNMKKATSILPTMTIA